MLRELQHLFGHAEDIEGQLLHITVKLQSLHKRGELLTLLDFIDESGEWLLEHLGHGDAFLGKPTREVHQGALSFLRKFLQFQKEHLEERGDIGGEEAVLKSLYLLWSIEQAYFADDGHQKRNVVLQENALKHFFEEFQNEELEKLRLLELLLEVSQSLLQYLDQPRGRVLIDRIHFAERGSQNNDLADFLRNQTVLLFLVFDFLLELLDGLELFVHLQVLILYFLQLGHERVVFENVLVALRKQVLQKYFFELGELFFDGLFLDEVSIESELQFLVLPLDQLHLHLFRYALN